MISALISLSRLWSDLWTCFPRCQRMSSSRQPLIRRHTPRAANHSTRLQHNKATPSRLLKNLSKWKANYYPELWPYKVISRTFRWPGWTADMGVIERRGPQGPGNKENTNIQNIVDSQPGTSDDELRSKELLTVHPVLKCETLQYPWNCLVSGVDP